MGMWIVQSLRKELCPDKDYNDIAEGAKNSCYNEIIDANDIAFFSPKSMKQAIDDYLTKNQKQLPISIDDYFRCAYVGIAYGYKTAIKDLGDCTNTEYKKIYIVGGGAKNNFLNELTEKICGVKVHAFPIEATALGNLKIQMEREI